MPDRTLYHPERSICGEVQPALVELSPGRLVACRFAQRRVLPTAAGGTPGPEHDAGAESVNEPLVEVVSGPPVDVIHSRRSWPWSMRKGRSSHRSVIPYARWPTGDRWPSPYRAMCFVCAGASQRRSFSAEDIALGPVCATPAQRLLDRIGQQPGKLSCGVRPPLDLSPRGSCSGVAVEPTILENECSGKHIGMLSLAARHAVRCRDGQLRILGASSAAGGPSECCRFTGLEPRQVATGRAVFELVLTFAGGRFHLEALR